MSSGALSQSLTSSVDISCLVSCLCRAVVWNVNVCSRGRGHVVKQKVVFFCSFEWFRGKRSPA